MRSGHSWSLCAWQHANLLLDQIHFWCHCSVHVRCAEVHCPRANSTHSRQQLSFSDVIDERSSADAVHQGGALVAITCLADVHKRTAPQHVVVADVVPDW